MVLQHTLQRLTQDNFKETQRQISINMTSPQKAKGSGFEREVAKFLSDLYGESFIRAPGSGAYIGGKNQHRTAVLHEGQVRSFKGDIVPGQSFSKMNIECKFYADFPFHLLLSGDCKVINTWIEQLMDVADTGDVGQGDGDPFLGRDVNASNTCQTCFPLCCGSVVPEPFFTTQRASPPETRQTPTTPHPGAQRISAARVSRASVG